jgi:hypothetical protein
MMLIKTEIPLPLDIYEGIKFLERCKAIPYADLRDGNVAAEHAQGMNLSRVAHWIASHPQEYEVGRMHRSFVCDA